MSTSVRFYLIFYNILQTFGWSVILWKTLYGISSGTSMKRLYQSCELELQIFQTAALLEIVHSAVGFVRSPVQTTVVQVFSRVSVIWLVLYKVMLARESIGVLFLLIAWSVTEVVRYSYYGLGLINALSKTHIWLRYTLFIVLYPLGVTGELLAILAALPEVAIKKHFTLEMPNSANLGFSFWWYLIFYIISYLPGFPLMFVHMIKQRRKAFFKQKSARSLIN